VCFLVLPSVKKKFLLIMHCWLYSLLLENWLSALLIINTFISCSNLLDSKEKELHFFVVAILLGWMELLLLSGSLSLFSV